MENSPKMGAIRTVSIEETGPGVYVYRFSEKAVLTINFYAIDSVGSVSENDPITIDDAVNYLHKGFVEYAKKAASAWKDPGKDWGSPRPLPGGGKGEA